MTHGDDTVTKRHHARWERLRRKMLKTKLADLTVADLRVAKLTLFDHPAHMSEADLDEVERLVTSKPSKKKKRGAMIGRRRQKKRRHL